MRLEISSPGLRRLSGHLNAYVDREDFRRGKEASSRIRQAMEDFSIVLVIENNCLTVTPGTAGSAYEDFLGEGSSGAGPFMGTLQMSVLEEEIFSIYRKKYPEIFDNIQKFAQSFPDFEGDSVLSGVLPFRENYEGARLCLLRARQMGGP